MVDSGRCALDGIRGHALVDDSRRVDDDLRSVEAIPVDEAAKSCDLFLLILNLLLRALADAFAVGLCLEVLVLCCIHPGRSV